MYRRRIWLAAVVCTISTIISACAIVPPASIETRPMTAIDTSWKTGGGFDLAEAKALIEFCTALDYGNGQYGSPTYHDKGIAKPSNAAGWQEVYPQKETLPANSDPPSFKPYDNAWKLYRKINTDIFVIAIRGTIDTKGSILDDVIATSVADGPVRLPIDDTHMLSFFLAETPRSETHLGWTYAMAELMFNADHGILRVLRDRVPPGSRLLITGHSQGAAVATLVHAFLHYALVRDPSNKFGLNGSGYTVKSYVFAQPKPGNWQFAMDFARIANGQAFVINNDRDWVPQVPLSIQFIDEPGADLLTQINKQPSLGGIVNSLVAAGAIGFAEGQRAAIALHVEEDTIKAIVRDGDLDARYFEPGVAASPAYSINYAVAGTQVPVFGSAAPAGLIVDDGPMSQHHGPTYRTLIELPPAQGGLSPPSAQFGSAVGM
jgi:hypothetical protein